MRCAPARSPSPPAPPRPCSSRPDAPAAAAGIADIRCTDAPSLPGRELRHTKNELIVEHGRAAPPRHRSDCRRERRDADDRAARSRTPMPTRRSRTRTSSCSRARGTALAQPRHRAHRRRGPVLARAHRRRAAAGRPARSLRRGRRRHRRVVPRARRTRRRARDRVRRRRHADLDGERVPDLARDRHACRRAARCAGGASPRRPRQASRRSSSPRAAICYTAGDAPVARRQGLPARADPPARSRSSRCPAARPSRSSATSSRRSSSGSMSSPRSATARATSRPTRDAGVTADRIFIKLPEFSEELAAPLAAHEATALLTHYAGALDGF